MCPHESRLPRLAHAFKAVRGSHLRLARMHAHSLLRSWWAQRPGARARLNQPSPLATSPQFLRLARRCAKLLREAKFPPQPYNPRHVCTRAPEYIYLCVCVCLCECVCVCVCDSSFCRCGHPHLSSGDNSSSIRVHSHWCCVCAVHNRSPQESS